MESNLSYTYYAAPPVEDPIVGRVMSYMAERSHAGMLKYGVTMERPDIGTVEWLRHAQEEALDLAIYLERCIQDLSKAPSRS